MEAPGWQKLNWAACGGATSQTEELMPVSTADRVRSSIHSYNHLSPGAEQWDELESILDTYF